MIAALVATFLFSASVICANRSAQLLGGLEANFWRLVLATLFLGSWSFAFGQGLSGDAVWVFIISGVVGIGIGDFGLFQALPRLGSRLTLLLTLCLTAPCAALMEWWWMGTGLTLAQIGSCAVILAGVFITLLPDRRLPLSKHQVVTGTLYSILAAVGGGGGAVLSRKAYEIARLADQPIDGPTAAFQRVLGGIVIAGVMFGLARWSRTEARIQPDMAQFGSSLEKWRKVSPYVVANSLAGLTIGVSFMQWALETTEAGLVMAIIATTPIVVIPLARMFEGERITAKSLVGGFVAVAGGVALALARN